MKQWETMSQVDESQVLPLTFAQTYNNMCMLQECWDVLIKNTNTIC